MKIKNLVAKYCSKFNRVKVEPDKKKLYSRKDKHCKKSIDFSNELSFS